MFPLFYSMKCVQMKSCLHPQVLPHPLRYPLYQKALLGFAHILFHCAPQCDGE